jgi:hypothetical protein
MPNPAKDKSWMLKSLAPKHRSQDEYERIAKESNASAFLSPISIDRFPLSDLIRSPTFRLIQVHETRQAGAQTLFRLEFDNTHPKEDLNAYPVQKGWIELDPERSWTVARWDVVWHSGETNRGWIEYGPLVDGVALPRKRRAEGEFDGPGGRRSKSVVEHIYDISLNELPLSEEQATLPAFGLPEPQELVAPAWYARWQVWLIAVGGVLCILAGWVLRKRAASTR